MFDRLATSKAREKFADIINLVGFEGRRVLIERHGKRVAAVVPPEDLELLEELENQGDLEAARAALRERGKSIPLKDIKAELGL